MSKFSESEKDVLKSDIQKKLEQRKLKCLQSHTLNKEQKYDVVKITYELSSIFKLEKYLGKRFAIITSVIIILVGLLFYNNSILEKTFENAYSLVALIISIAMIFLSPTSQEMAQLEIRKIDLEAKLSSYECYDLLK